MEPVKVKEERKIKKSIKRLQRAKKTALLTIAKKKYRELFPSDKRFDRHILA